MPVLIKLLFLTATLWSTVYSLSYALHCLKKRSFKAAVATTVLSLAALILSVAALFFPMS